MHSTSDPDACWSLGGLTSAFQPRPLMIAPAAVGCKRLLRVDLV